MRLMLLIALLAGQAVTPTAEVVIPPFGVAFCHPMRDVDGKPTNIDEYRLVVDNLVQLPWAGALIPVPGNPTASCFETPKTLTINPGTHTLTLAVSNGLWSAPSAPVTFVVPELGGDQQTSTPLSCALTGAAPNFSIACTPPPVTTPPTLPSEPAVCASAPLVVKVWAWPASSGMKPSVGFDTTPEWASWTITRAPKMSLSVVDVRGCKATVSR